MKTAYLDCFSGISGDMTIGALVDAGLPVSFLKEVLSSLELGGVTLETKPVKRLGIAGTSVSFSFDFQGCGMNYKKIVTVIENANTRALVKKDITEDALAVFDIMARAEEKVHGIKKDKLHFHEAGGKDTIADICCVLAGLAELDVQKVFSSPLNLGSGFVSCAHGLIPAPGPAVAEIVFGFEVYSAHVKKELTTPTGAAIATYLARKASPLPLMKVQSTGYGAGSNDNCELPNMLRIFLGLSSDDATQEEPVMGYALSDEVVILEANIDDINPQTYDYLFERLFKQGALDVFLTPTIMKKSRPAHTLCVITKQDRKYALSKIIFRETTTTGIRERIQKRTILDRETVKVKTSHGELACKKIKTIDGNSTIMPEYDDCKKIASKKKLPLHLVIERLKAELNQKNDKSQDIASPGQESQT